MSDTTSSTSKQTPGAPGTDAASPPPYSYQGEDPPPYSGPATYNLPKTETACISHPTTEYDSFCDINPSETTPIISSSPFDDKTVRRGFVRKACVLSLTSRMQSVLYPDSPAAVHLQRGLCVHLLQRGQRVQTNPWAYFSSIIVFAVVSVALSLCKSFSRRHPWNIIGLSIVTLSLSYMVGTIASYHDTKAVVITMAVTLLISVAIIAFSAQTRYDFTICYGLLLIVALDLVMFGFFCIFYYSYIIDIAYGCLGALLYSLFLMVDCQLMMGTRSHRVDPEEYINAALMVYMDIVLIFLCQLRR